MIINVLNAILWFLTAFFFLLNTIIFAYGKRIIKQTKWILDIINLGMIAIFFKEVTQTRISWLYVLLVVMTLILLRTIIVFFMGSEYKVYTHNKALLCKSMDKAIASVMSIKAIQKEKEEDILFILEGSSHSIQIKDINEKSYMIKFKKWTSYDLKKQILMQLKDELDTYDRFPMNKTKVILQMVAAIVFMIAGLFAISYSVMENNQFSFTEVKMPNELYFIDRNDIYTDISGIQKVHQQLKANAMYKKRHITNNKVIEYTEFQLEYGYGGKVIYIGDKYSYVFVHDFEIRDKSIFHWVCWKIHTIYDKKKGTYFSTYTGNKLHTMIKNIISD